MVRTTRPRGGALQGTVSCSGPAASASDRGRGSTALGRGPAQELGGVRRPPLPRRRGPVTAGPVGVAGLLDPEVGVDKTVTRPHGRRGADPATFRIAPGAVGPGRGLGDRTGSVARGVDDV